MRSVKNSRTVYFKVTAHIKYDDKGSLMAAINDIHSNLHYYMNCEGDHNYSTRIEGARMVSEVKQKKKGKTHIIKCLPVGKETAKLITSMKKEGKL